MPQPIGAAAGRDGAGTRPAYTLDSGDKLRVVVFGQEGLSASYSVDTSGNITMPLIGAVPRARHDARRPAAGDRRQAASNGFVREPHVAVEVETYRPFFILGEVTLPGQYPYVPNMTVETAVAIAGGYTPRAFKQHRSRSRRKVERPDREARRVAELSGAPGRHHPHRRTLVLTHAGARPLKILHVLRSPVGGLFRHVLDLARGQAARGHQVGIVADASTGGARAERRSRRSPAQLALGLTPRADEPPYRLERCLGAAPCGAARARDRRRRAARPRRQRRRLCAARAAPRRDPRLHAAWRQPALRPRARRSACSTSRSSRC